MESRRSSAHGCLIGTAVGDALGLPYEGLSHDHAKRFLGPPDRYRFLFGRGMVSDDTEHACLAAQSLIASRGDPDQFENDLARRLRNWLLEIPAGIGWATLRAILRLWLGYSPKQSGVNSVGNGPCMRAPILGTVIDDLPSLRSLIRISTRLTHTDSRVEHGAFAIALAAHLASRVDVTPYHYAECLRESLQPEGADLLSHVASVVTSIEQGESTFEYANRTLPRHGVSGFVLEAVPISLHAWLSAPRDYRAAVTAVIGCGGDTDTTAAIVGGIIGAATGPDAIPEEWRNGLLEWLRSPAWIQQLSVELCGSLRRKEATAPPSWLIRAWIRNLLFVPVVLVHGVTRSLRKTCG